MKKILGVVVVILLIFSFEYGLSDTQKKPVVKVKVKDNCDPKNNSTCTVGQNGNMTLKVCDYKNKFTSLSSLTIDPELPDIPFDCPSGYSSYTNFFLPDDDNPGFGIGVINGVLYINELNPTEDFYLWIFEDSQTFDQYDQWAQAIAITPDNPTYGLCNE